MSYRIVKFPLVGGPDKPIIVKVSTKRGGHELDLDLLATDGDEVWRGKVRERHVDRLRDSEYNGSRQEWESLLGFALGFHAESDLSSEMREGLDVQCKISDQATKSKLTVSLQISVEDIKSKRGTLQLEYSTRTEDVSFYEWTCHLVDARNTLQNQVVHQQADLSGEGGRVESLQRQLNELIAAKKEQEIQMLAKFTRLLNEKKLRIRVQQRQIAEQDRPASSDFAARQTSVRKRKHAKVEEDLDSNPESEGFDNMDMDEETDNEQIVHSDQGQRTESDTESEPEADHPQTSSALERQAGPQTRESDLPPPPRTLPFSSKTKVKAESSSLETPIPMEVTDASAKSSTTDSDDGDDEL